MKTALISFVFVFSASAMASDEAPCKGNKEAQIIAEIEETVSDSLTYCIAKLGTDSIKLFNESRVCPLSLSDILKKGVHFPLQNGHDCEIKSGQMISGVLISENGIIRLEE